MNSSLFANTFAGLGVDVQYALKEMIFHLLALKLNHIKLQGIWFGINEVSFFYCCMTEI